MPHPPAVAQALFSCVFESAPIGMAILAPDSTPVEVNRAACEMLGYSARELLALPPHAITTRDEWAQDEAQRRRLLAGAASQYSRVKRYLRRDGRMITARLHCGLVRSDTGEPLHFVTQMQPVGDAADPGPDAARRPWTARLREEALLLDHARDAIVLQDLDRRIQYWNHGAERLFGYTAEAAMGRDFEELLGSGAALGAAAREQLRERGGWTGLLECVDAHGQILTVERRCTILDFGGEEPPALLSVDTDVTEQRRAEKEIVLLNNLLEQRIRSRTAQLQESNEDLRGFAYSLAHDLRAPLSSVEAFSAQLERRLQGALDERCSHYLGRVRAGVQLMSDLTEGLLTLANLSSAPLLRHSVDLSALAVAAIERLRERDPGRRVTVVIHETPRTEGDVRLLTDLMENLLGNAWKFTSRNPEARIEFGGTLGPRGAFQYCVRDNGAGFDPAYAYKLFNPFQRLHSPGEFAGTGIGLAVVRKIVSRHGGAVWADSRPGAGASFHFTLTERRGGGAAGPLSA
ncbi:PAS domain S-box protein [Ramlibacter sp.]|uniref:sensor histidine kinase n=1 Tax=Ramlibacter sp. TaxID=1917967 RepID=UPI002C5B2FA9|nr:PAS domain S-box protein [Ramlibacter sp.]HWI81000.1 PAS domain S-box protein [Ramlibacter sp.]